MSRFISIFLLLFALVCRAQKQQIYYVAVKGKDSNSGTLDKPFASLQKARNVIRAGRKLHPKDSFTVFICKGSYFLSESFVLDSNDGGTKDNPVTYRPYVNEEVHFTGGISVPVNKAVRITDPSVLARLVPEAKEKILQVNLKALGIYNYGTMKPKGFGRSFTAAPMELFCNQTAMKPARWPNDSLVPIGKVIDPGSIPRNGDFSHRGGKFTYDVQRPSRWALANDLWISGFFKYGYADDAVKIASLDTASKTMATVQETMYGFEGGKIFQRWYAFNLLEEIDQPGEYYIDRKAGILYFMPPTEPLESLELSLTESPLLVMENASYVHFKNIIFECSRGMGLYLEKGRENSIEGCTFRNLGMVAIMLGKGINGGEGFQHTAGSGHVISSCHIYNTGSGGIILNGGNRLTLEKGNNQVINCRIHDFNRIERAYKSAVNINGVGNIIRNCEIYNCPGSAIYLHGNDHVIEYNNIHQAVTDGDDMGAIYFGRDPSELGNKVRYNFFHHLGNAYGSIMAVYHDDGACGMEVTGNVFYKAGSRTVMIGGGNDNVYRNNIFIDCPLAFHIDNRLLGWAKGFVKRGELFEKRLQTVNYQQPPYATAYPATVNYFDDKAGLPKRNFIEDNVFVNVTMLTNGRAEWSNIGRNLTLCGDPGFVNYEKMNFDLLPGSEIFKLLPAFKKIPFQSIGIETK